MGAHASAIQAYIRAKDENRPHLMPSAFAPDAYLEMKVETGNISFSPASKGIEAITQVLVRDFGRAYENVDTFCLDKPPALVGADRAKYASNALWSGIDEEATRQPMAQ